MVMFSSFAPTPSYFHFETIFKTKLSSKIFLNLKAFSLTFFTKKKNLIFITFNIHFSYLIAIFLQNLKIVFFFKFSY